VACRRAPPAADRGARHRGRFRVAAAVCRPRRGAARRRPFGRWPAARPRSQDAVRPRADHVLQSRRRGTSWPS
jgi:hypothetical protein